MKTYKVKADFFNSLMIRSHTLLTVFLLTIVFYACNKDEENEPKFTLEVETISAKWNVDGSNDYESFEFNKSGNYIIVEKSSITSTKKEIILFGTYEIIDNNTIVLSDFGTIKISELEDNSISFSIQLTSSTDSEIIVSALKQKEVRNTGKTKLLCRTWVMVTYNGEVVTDTEKALSVLFSEAGTYFVEFVMPDDGNEGSLAYWKWKDEIETNLLYSWDAIPEWREKKELYIVELTNSALRIYEKYENGNEVLIDLKPVNTIKSTQILTNVK